MGGMCTWSAEMKNLLIGALGVACVAWKLADGNWSEEEAYVPPVVPMTPAEKAQRINRTLRDLEADWARMDKAQELLDQAGVDVNVYDVGGSPTVLGRTDFNGY